MKAMDNCSMHSQTMSKAEVEVAVKPKRLASSALGWEAVEVTNSIAEDPKVQQPFAVSAFEPVCMVKGNCNCVFFIHPQFI